MINSSELRTPGFSSPSAVVNSSSRSNTASVLVLKPLGYARPVIPYSSSFKTAPGILHWGSIKVKIIVTL